MSSIMEMVRADERREKYALARGLPKDATWSKVFAHDAEAYRKRKIRRYGLPESATRIDILEYETKLRLNAEDEKHRADARELGLPETATKQQIWAAQEALPIGQYQGQYPVDWNGEVESDDSDLG